MHNVKTNIELVTDAGEDCQLNYERRNQDVPSQTPSSAHEHSQQQQQQSHRQRGIGMALLSGCLGATAACFGKLAFSPSSTLPSPSFHFHDDTQPLWKWWYSGDLQVNCTNWMLSIDNYWHVLSFRLSSLPDHFVFCLIWHGIPRAVYFIIMLLCNTVMLGTWFQGMQDVGSITGTALATSANFLLSAAYGYLLWNEHASSTSSSIAADSRSAREQQPAGMLLEWWWWWLGYILIWVGALVIMTAASPLPDMTSTTSPSSPSSQKPTTTITRTVSTTPKLIRISESQ